MRRILINIGMLFACFAWQSNHAAPGPGLLFNVTTSGITLNITTVRPNHTYPHAGIKINTPGHALQYAGTECTPNTNGYCLFSVSDTTPALITITNFTGTVNVILCLNGIGPLSCQDYNISRPSPRFVYITDNRANVVFICPINGDGSLGTCSESDGNGTFALASEEGAGITLNAKKTVLYLTNFETNTIAICSIFTANGSIGTCISSDASGTLSAPNGAIGLNSKNNLAYIASSNTNTISICPINGDGSFGTCSSSDENGAFDYPVQVALNSANTVAYIPNRNNSTLSICPINSDGSFGTCTSSDGNGTFSTPQGVSFNATESFLYVANNTNGGTVIPSSVSICPVNNDGSLGTCSSTTGTPSFDFADNTTTGLFMSNPTMYGYIPNSFYGEVYICPLSTSDGSIGTCTTSNGNSNFEQPSAVALG